MPEFNATLIVILISFVAFMLIMKTVYFDPILKIKHERENKLIDDRDATQRFAEDYERIHAEYQAGLKKARVEAHQIIQEVRQKAKTTAQQTLTEARGNAQTELDARMADLNAWRETTYGQLAGERKALTVAILDKVTAGGKKAVAGGM